MLMVAGDPNSGRRRRGGGGDEDIVHARAREGGEGPERISEGVNRGNEVDYCGWGTVAPNTKGTKYSVPVASIWVM